MGPRGGKGHSHTWSLGGPARQPDAGCHSGQVLMTSILPQQPRQTLDFPFPWPLWQCLEIRNTNDLWRPTTARGGKLFPTSSAATVPFWTLRWSQRDEVSWSLTFPHIEARTINRELSRQRDKLICFLKFLPKHSQQAQPQTVCLSIVGPWAMADPWEPGRASWWQGDSRFLCRTVNRRLWARRCSEPKWNPEVWVVGLLEERMEVAFAFTALHRDLVTSAATFHILSACCLLCKPFRLPAEQFTAANTC